MKLLFAFLVAGFLFVPPSFSSGEEITDDIHSAEAKRFYVDAVHSAERAIETLDSIDLNSVSMNALDRKRIEKSVTFAKKDAERVRWCAQALMKRPSTAQVVYLSETAAASEYDLNELLNRFSSILNKASTDQRPVEQSYQIAMWRHALSSVSDFKSPELSTFALGAVIKLEESYQKCSEEQTP
jgi:hypothetical protein